MLHRLEIAYSIDTELCSASARMFWCADTAKGLNLLDDDLTQLWLLGEFRDRDLLDNIASHGELPNLCESQNRNIRHIALTLTSEVNNLLQGLVLSEDGNLELSR